MKLSGLLAYAGVITALLVLATDDSLAQQRTHGSTEISVMHGFVLASSSEHNSDDVTILMTPVPPVWRLSCWTRSRITIDLGFSMLAAMSDGENASILNFEGGVGANLADRDAKTIPFVGVMGGLVSLSLSHEETEADPYIGAQIGSRVFIRDYAAVRIQAGLRHVFVKRSRGVNLFEAVAGLSFFL